MANTGSGNQSNPSEVNTAPTTQPSVGQNSAYGTHITQTLSVKLDRNNFLLWKNMVMPVIKGHNLEGYLLGTKECPPEFIATQTTVRQGEAVELIQNPEFLKWSSSDKLLMGWMYSSMTSDIAMKVMGCTSSNKLWTAVEESFGILNKSRVMFLTGELQRVRKGSMTMDQYLTTVKQLADNLEIAGKNIDHSDLVMKVLSGLDDEYTPIVVQISSRESISWYELSSVLMTFESRLEHLNHVRSNFTSLNVNQSSVQLAHRTSTSFGRGLRGPINGRSSSYRGRPRGRGKFTNGRQNEIRGPCQICGLSNHSASWCYNRFDERYMGSKPPNSGQQSINSGPSAYVASPRSFEDPAWFVDSGASNHVTSDKGNMSAANRYEGKAKLLVGNGDMLHIAHVGNGKIHTLYDKEINLHRLLHVLEIKRNLISVSQLTNDNTVFMEFYSNCCAVKDLKTKKILLQGELNDGLYQLQLPPFKPDSTSFQPNHQNNFQCFSTKSSSDQLSSVSRISTSQLDLWHRRLGHPSIQVMSQVFKSCNKTLKYNEIPSFCESCKFGKSHALPFNTSTSHAENPLDLIHTDVWGPAPINSTSGFRYYIIFVDDHSRYTWIYPMKQKSEALTIFTQFKNLIENKLEKKIKAVQSDWGGEFRNFNKLVSDSGIELRHSCPYTSGQNGRAERKHRHITETGLTLLAQAQMPLFYWWESFKAATYLINRLPTPVLHHKTPYQTFFDKTFDYNQLKTFGCACFPCLRPYQKHKFSFHSQKCVYLGYGDSHKGYKCLSPSGRIYISRHVVFNELEFPFKTGFLNKQSQSQVCDTSDINYLPLCELNHDTTPINVAAVAPAIQPEVSPATEPGSEGISARVERDDVIGYDEENQEMMAGDEGSDSQQTRTESQNASEERNLPDNNVPQNLGHQMITRSKAGIFKPKAYTSQQIDELATVEPISADEALASINWKSAMQDEYDALMKNETWTLVPHKAGMKVIGNKWVYKLKFDPSGKVSRHKARLVAKGFLQTPGVDFSETFSP